jgi:hypothetical protein
MFIPKYVLYCQVLILSPWDKSHATSHHRLHESLSHAPHFHRRCASQVHNVSEHEVVGQVPVYHGIKRI